MIVVILALALVAQTAERDEAAADVDRQATLIEDTANLKFGINPSSADDILWVKSAKNRGVHLDKWIQISQNRTTTTYVRLSDIKSVDTIRKIWFKRTYPKTTTNAYREAKMQTVVDCVGETMTSVSMVSYKADGTVNETSNFRYSDQSAIPAAPDTVAAVMLEAVCNKSNR